MDANTIIDGQGHLSSVSNTKRMSVRRDQLHGKPGGRDELKLAEVPRSAFAYTSVHGRAGMAVTLPDLEVGWVERRQDISSVNTLKCTLDKHVAS